jgi:ankyrin repeat protein
MKSHKKYIFAIMLVSAIVFVSCSGSIHNSAWEDDFEEVKKFLDNGGDVNARSISGGTLISYAAGGGNLELVKLLFNKGALLNETDEEQATALHYAAREGNLRIVDFLLVKGAIPTICANKYRTESYERIEHGSLQGTPLHWAAAYEQIGVVRVLIARGIDVNLTDEGGYTALHEAARRGDSQIVKLLLDHGALVNSKSITGIMPLHLAVLKDSKETVEILLDHGANVNARGVFSTIIADNDLRNSNSKKALELSKSSEVEELLIKHGATLN